MLLDDDLINKINESVLWVKRTCYFGLEKELLKIIWRGEALRFYLSDRLKVEMVSILKSFSSGKSLEVKPKAMKILDIQ